MDALLDNTALLYPLNVRPGFYMFEIQTIGDAALFIIKLPKEFDGRLHWTLAGTAVTQAHRRRGDASALEHATLTMETALATDRMLQEQAAEQRLLNA
jgi:hypothetical protein